MCVCVCVRVRVRVCVCVHSSLHSMNESVTLLNLTEFIYNFNTWLIVMFCIFVDALYVWKFGMSPKQIPVYI